MKQFTIELPNRVSLNDRAYIVAKGLTHGQDDGVTLSDLCTALKVTAGELWPKILSDNRFVKPQESKTTSRLNVILKLTVW